MYSRYTPCKRVPKKRTKKRQTQVKRQGSSETSRIKLESVETSISDRENTQKGMTTTTSGTNQRQGNTTEGKKTSNKIRGKQRYDEYN